MIDKSKAVVLIKTTVENDLVYFLVNFKRVNLDRIIFWCRDFLGEDGSNWDLRVGRAYYRTGYAIIYVTHSMAYLFKLRWVEE